MAAREDVVVNDERRPQEMGRLAEAAVAPRDAQASGPLIQRLENFRSQFLAKVADPGAGERAKSAIGAIIERIQSGELPTATPAAVVSAVRQCVENTGVSAVIVNQIGEEAFGNDWNVESGTGDITFGEVEDALSPRYEIEIHLGQGGMGAVYRAFDTVLGRYVAIKVLTSDEQDLYDRFLREQKLHAGVGLRPEFPIIFDAGKKGRISFVVMELLAGTNASDLQATSQLLQGECERLGVKFPMPLWQTVVLKLLRPVISALQFLHDKRRVDHRDLKLENVMLPPQVGPANRDLLKKLNGIKAPEEGGVLSKEDDEKVQQAWNIYLATVLDILQTTKLIDFGLAKKREEQDLGKVISGTRKSPKAAAAGTGPVTEVGVIVGTPGYIPPELICEKVKSSRRADTYALGVLIFEALTGSSLSRKNANSNAVVGRAIQADADRKKMEGLKEGETLSNPVPLSLVELDPVALAKIEGSSKTLAALLKSLTAVTTDPELLLEHEIVSGMGSVAHLLDELLPSESREHEAERTLYRHRVKIWQVVTALVAGAAATVGGEAFSAWSSKNAREREEVRAKAQKEKTDERWDWYNREMTRINALPRKTAGEILTVIGACKTFSGQLDKLMKDPDQAMVMQASGTKSRVQAMEIRLSPEYAEKAYPLIKRRMETGKPLSPQEALGIEKDIRNILQTWEGDKKRSPEVGQLNEWLRGCTSKKPQ